MQCAEFSAGMAGEPQLVERVPPIRAHPFCTRNTSSRITSTASKQIAHQGTRGHISVERTTISERVLEALPTYGQVQKCRPWGNVFGDLRLIYSPARIKTFSPRYRGTSRSRWLKSGSELRQLLPKCDGPRCDRPRVPYCSTGLIPSDDLKNYLLARMMTSPWWPWIFAGVSL